LVQGSEEAVMPVLQQHVGRLGLFRGTDFSKLTLEYEPYVRT